MRSTDWLDCRDFANGRTYEIRQNKYAPLRLWLFLVGGMIACIALAGISVFFGGSRPDSLFGALGIIPGFGVVLFGFAAFGGAFFLLPATLLRKNMSSFGIDGNGITLKTKLKQSYPDRIAFGEISHIHYGVSGKPSGDQTIVVGGGLAGATAGASNDIGNLIRRQLAKTGWGVWLNVRGRDVYLANALTEAQALYLYDDLGNYVRRQ